MQNIESTSSKRLRFATRAIHTGQEPDPLTGAVSVPIYPTSTYVQEEIGKNKGYEYARVSNPTRDRLETNLAALEGGIASPRLRQRNGCDQRHRDDAEGGRPRRCRTQSLWRNAAPFQSGAVELRTYIYLRRYVRLSIMSSAHSRKTRGFYFLRRRPIH